MARPSTSTTCERSSRLTPELPAWRAVVAPAATKSLRRLPRTDRERIVNAVSQLPKGDTRRLKGRVDEWRLRVGDWRVLLRVDRAAKVIVVTAVKARGGAYDR